MQLMRAKKRGNAASQLDRDMERNPLLGTEIEMSSTGGGRPIVPTPPSSGNNSIGGGFLSSRRDKRKTSTIATAHPDMEERVSLLDAKGGPSSSGVPKRRFRLANTTGRPRGGGSFLFASWNKQNWALSRLMKYLALMLISSTLTFVLLHKESKTVHWAEYENILEPDGNKEKRCFVSVSLVWVVGLCCLLPCTALLLLSLMDYSVKLMVFCTSFRKTILSITPLINNTTIFRNKVEALSLNVVRVRIQRRNLAIRRMLCG
jgi:hypothetical protein